MALTQIKTSGIADDAITADKLPTNLDLSDNQKIRFGTGNDLELYHDGSHSYIKDTGTGNLKVQANSSIITASDKIQFESANESEVLAVFYQNDRCELYYDNSKKLATESAGVAIWNGNIRIPNDTYKMTFGASADLEIYHNGSHSYIKDSGTGNLVIQTNVLGIQAANGLEDIAKFSQDGAVELYYNNVKTFTTNTLGIIIYGDEGGTAQVDFAADQSDDNSDKWKAGATDSGYFFISNKSSGAWEQNIECNREGNVELYYDNSKKLETTSYGIKASSVKVFDDEYFYAGNSSDLKIYHNGSHSYIDNNTGHLILRTNVDSDVGGDIYIKTHDDENAIECIHDAGVSLYYNNVKKFETTNTGVSVTGHIFPGANNTYGLGNDSNTWTGLNIGDHGEIELGNSQDLKIYHDGSNSYLVNTTGFLKIKDESNVRIDTDAFAVNKGDNSEAMIVATANEGVDLYFDNVKKLATTAAGVTLSAASLLIPDKSGDNNVLKIGTGQDLQIYHDGTDNYIDSIAGNLYLRGPADASKWIILQAHSGENSVIAKPDGNVELYYDGIKKFETKSTGVKVLTDTANTTHEIRNSNASTPYGQVIDFDSASPDNNSQWFLRCKDSTQDKLYIYSDGDIDNHDNSYGGMSDVKLKENIVDASSQWNDVKAVKVRKFNFKSDAPSDKRLGVIAQEMETISPGLVEEHPDRDNDNNDLGTTTKSVKYSILYMKAFKALQEAMAKIETIETKVAALEAK